MRCGNCSRRMEGTRRDNRVYYRCAARSIVPGSPILATHPRNVYLPERRRGADQRVDRQPVREGAPGDTVRRMLDADAGKTATARGKAAARAVAEAEQRLRRLQSAIEAGVDPAALVEPINRAQQEVDAARAELQHNPTVQTLSRAEIDAMIDYLGDVGSAFNRAEPAHLEELYGSLCLEVIYEPGERIAQLSIRPRGVVNVSEGGLEPPRPTRALAPQASASAIPPLGPAAQG